MKSYQQFFAELKRRKVFKVAAVYGAVAFALLQVAEPLASALRLPDTFVPFVVALLLLGFPVALVLAWAFEVTPEGVQRTESASAEEIDEIVAQPMSQRWPSGVLALLGVAALVAGAWWTGRQSAAPATGASAEGRADSVQLAYPASEEDDRPSIAVLPFADMSPQGDQEYFSDGMTEEILNTLAKIRELSVQGRTSAFAYKDRNEDLRKIGDELGVGYLVEGSVRKAGDQLRITAQLIDAETGNHLWSEQYDRRMDDVFAIQTEIAQAIADELRVPLGLEDDETLVDPTGDLTAYDLYLSGRTMMRERGAALLEAIELFEGAIARDSSWAPAWAALAEAREIRIFYPETFENGQWTPEAVDRSLDAAETAAERALALDSANASAWVALGSVQRDRGRWRASERSYRRALALDRDNPEAHQQYSELLATRGRIAESVRAADRAAALDPAPIRLSRLGFSLRLDDRTETALAVLDVGLKRDRDTSFVRLWGSAGFLHMVTGQPEEAIALYRAVWRDIRELGGPDALPSPERLEAGIRYVAAGDTAAMPPDGFEDEAPPQLLLAAGHEEAAIAALGRVTGVPEYLPGWASIWDPLFDPIRSDPRVREFMEEQGVGDAGLRRTPPSERTRPLILRDEAVGAATPRPGNVSAEAPAL